MTVKKTPVADQTDGAAEETIEGKEETTEEKKEDMVKYESFAKLLKEKKNLASKFNDVQAQLNEIKAEKESEEKKNLEESGKFKELYDAAEKEKEELRKLLDNQSAKLRADRVLNAVKGHVKLVHEDLYTFIDTSAIEFDEDGHPTKESVEMEANRLRAKYPTVSDEDASRINKNPTKDQEIKGDKAILEKMKQVGMI